MVTARETARRMVARLGQEEAMLQAEAMERAWRAVIAHMRRQTRGRRAQLDQ